MSTSSAECNRCSSPSSLVCGQLLTICDLIWHLPQRHMSIAARPDFFRQYAQWPWLVWKQFRSAQWDLDTSNPGFRILGSSTRDWPPEPTSIHLVTGRWCLMEKCLSREACMMAGNSVKVRMCSYIVAIQHTSLSFQSDYPRQLCTWVLAIQYSTKQVTMIVVKSAGFWWWCTWWSWVAHLSRLYVMRVPILG